MHPSPFARPTPGSKTFARELNLERGEDPLVTVRRINSELFERFTYSPKSTRVDSPIDDALEARKGVCQDFTHIMLALVRQLGIPCRYVSGYLFHQADGSVRSADGSTHAWGEVWFPDLGWVGFDPTNNLPRRRTAHPRRRRPRLRRRAADARRLQRLAAVRSELSVAVRVGATGQSQTMVAHEVPTHMPWVSREVPSSLPRPDRRSRSSNSSSRIHGSLGERRLPRARPFGDAARSDRDPPSRVARLRRGADEIVHPESFGRSSYRRSALRCGSCRLRDGRCLRARAPRSVPARFP